MTEDIADKNKKKSKLGWYLGLIFFILLIVWIIFPIFSPSNHAKENTQLSYADSIKKQQKRDSAFIAAVTSTDDTSSVIIRVSDMESLNIPHTIDNQAGKPIKRVFTGRRINIAVIGVDSRLGASTKHADANHILSILLDSGAIEITSIPRDTPADAGMPDSSGQNKLTIVYAVKGRDAYFKEAASIAGLDKIHYYVEAGFSQVIGFLELLGYKDSHSTLQVLRSRTGLGGDDYQRSYNQGQFIRQTILKHFDKTNSVFADLIIHGGLALFNTNLTADKVKEIAYTLRSKGFPKSPNDISNKVRPALGINFKIYDFTDLATLEKLKKKIEHFNKSRADEDSTHRLSGSINVAPRLKNVLNRAIQDSAKRPQNVINSLETFFYQRAWLQVSNKIEREAIRDQLGNLLYNAYIKKKKNVQADNVKRVIDNEKNIFSKPVFHNNINNTEYYKH